METGGLVLVEKELDIAVDIGVGRGGSCGGGETAASLSEDRVAIPPFDFTMLSIPTKIVDFNFV